MYLNIRKAKGIEKPHEVSAMKKIAELLMEKLPLHTDEIDKDNAFGLCIV